MQLQLGQLRLVIPQGAVVEHLGQRIRRTGESAFIARLLLHPRVLCLRQRVLQLLQFGVRHAVGFGKVDQAVFVGVALQRFLGPFEVRLLLAQLTGEPLRRVLR